MQNYLVLLGFLFFSFSAVAQNDESKEKFMKQTFTNFKKNKIDEISEHFIDSVFLDHMITQIFEKENEELPAQLTRSKIHGERLAAGERFRKSLQNAYDKIYAETGKDLKKVKPEMKVYASRSEPVESFGVQYDFTANDKKVTLKLPEIVYDQEIKRYVILADKVRLRIDSKNEELMIEEVTIEAMEEAVVEAEAAADAAAEAAVEAAEEAVMDVEDAVDAVAEAVSEAAEAVEDAVMVEEVVDVVQPNNNYQGKVFDIVEQMPSFPGGEFALKEWLANNTLYPKQAADAQLVGNVYIQFIVGKDGSLRDSKIIRGIGLGTEKEAKRLVKKMPKWEPGKNRGRVVETRYTLAVPFGQY